MMLFIKVEPYWNVNAILVIGGIVWCCIKVEPYWNVNSTFPFTS